MEPEKAEQCGSEGSLPINDVRITKLLFDLERGKAALNARRLLDGKFGKNKVEVIRPGQFMPGPIRESGLKWPLLIKGDRYNFNPHMGVALTGTGPSATDLADRMDQEKEIETWDVSKQRPGPNWKLAQFLTYWHARQAHVAKQAGEEGKQPTVAGHYVGGGNDEELYDDADSGALLVLNRGDGGPKQWHTAAVAQRGINPEQATKLFSGESISLDHPNPNPAGSKGRDDKPSAGPLSDDIHPPPTILNLDLVRMLDRHLSRAPATAAAAEDARPGGGCALSRAGTDERLGSFAVGGGAGERAGSCGADKALGTAAAAEGAATSSKGVGGGSFSEAAAGGGGPPCAAGQHEGGSGSGRLPRGSRASGGVLDIGPTRTMHLQMTPMGGFADFKAAPGGAATWVYVLSGRQVVVLLPPTDKNRSLYMSWAQASLSQTLQSQVLDVFLGDYAEEAMRVEVKQNEALLIPCGWFYASVAPEDCINVCCFFWHPYALGDAARTQHLQLHLKQRDTDLSRKARLLLWCAALHYARNLREKTGLPAFRPTRPASERGTARHATPSSSGQSGGSLGGFSGGYGQQQQHRQSPRSRGPSVSGSGLSMGGGRRLGGGGSAVGTPPLQGFAAAAAAMQQQQAGMDSPVQSPSMRRGVKRARVTDPMDSLQLPASVIPLSAETAAAAAAASAAAAAGGAMTPRATSSAAAAAALAAPSGQKKLKLSMSTGGGGATPRSISRGGGQAQHAGAGGTAAAAIAAAAAAGGVLSGGGGEAHSGGTASVGARPQQQQQPQTSSGTPRLRLKGSTARQQQQQQDRQRWSYYSAAAAGGDDEELGDCQTSPVRHPPADDAYLDMFDRTHSDAAAAAAGSAGAAAAAGRHSRGQQQQQQQQQYGQQGGPYRQVDMSPIVGGVKGDVDALPPLNMGAAALLVPGSSDAGAAAAAAATAGGHTPRLQKLKLKVGSRTPSAAGTAAGALPTSSAAAAAAAVAAMAAGEASGANSPVAKSGDSAGAQAHTGVSRRSSPEESCCRNGSQGPAQQQGSGGSNEGSQLQQQQQHGQPPPQGAQQQQQQAAAAAARRVSDCGNSQPMLPPPPAGSTPRAAAAGSSSKAWMKFRMKTPTPSPQLPPLKAPAAAEASLPPLQLGQGAVVQQQQQQEARRLQVQQLVPPLQLDRLAAMQAAAEPQQQQQPPPSSRGRGGGGSIPQVDGAGDQPCGDAWLGPVQQQQQQQQQQREQLQQQPVALQQQQQQQQQQPGSGVAAGAAAASCWQGLLIPQCDGAGDDLRGGTLQGGPTLVMQPSPAGKGGNSQQQQQQQPVQDKQARPGTGAGGCVSNGHAQVHSPAPAAAAVIAKNPAVTSNLQTQQRRAAAAAAAAAAAGGSSAASPPVDVSPFQQQAAAGAGVPPTPAAGADVSPFQQQDDAAAAGDGGGAALVRARSAAATAAAAAAADGQDVVMQDAERLPAAATAAGEGGSISRMGSSAPAAAGAAADLAAAAAMVAALPARQQQQPGSRSNSPTHQQQQQQASTPPPAAAAGQNHNHQQQQQQQSQLVSQASQQPMLPPLPTKVSTWEIAELPVLLQYLQEQVATGDYGGLSAADLPVPDPAFLLEQLDEAVAEAVAQQQEEAVAAARRAAGATPPAQQQQGAGADAAPATQQQQHGASAAAAGRGQPAQPPRGLAELAGEVSAWQERCGNLHPDPPRFELLPVELTAALQQGFAVQQTLGWGAEQKANEEHQEPCIDETDPGAAAAAGGGGYGGGAAATGAGSYHSAGSYQSGAGTARGARAAAAAGGAGGGRHCDGGGGVGGGGGGVTGVKRAAPGAPAGQQQQAKKVDKMRKDLFKKKPGGR